MEVTCDWDYNQLDGLTECMEHSEVMTEVVIGAGIRLKRTMAL